MPSFPININLIPFIPFIPSKKQDILDGMNGMNGILVSCSGYIIATSFTSGFYTFRCAHA